MNLLLDTCTLLWAWGRPGRLTRRLQGLLRDPHNQVWVSAASAWELATKHRVGRFPSGGPILAEWDDRLARDGFRQLAISSRHALRAGSLPGAHRDPFDRMIAAQSLIEALRVATPDPEIAALGADTVW
jgi:PIN domain nuclease of toxin-antitoxin system